MATLRPRVFALLSLALLVASTDLVVITPAHGQTDPSPDGTQEAQAPDPFFEAKVTLSGDLGEEDDLAALRSALTANAASLEECVSDDARESRTGVLEVTLEFSSVWGLSVVGEPSSSFGAPMTQCILDALAPLRLSGASDAFRATLTLTSPLARRKSEGEAIALEVLGNPEDDGVSTLIGIDSPPPPEGTGLALGPDHQDATGEEGLVVETKFQEAPTTEADKAAFVAARDALTPSVARCIGDDLTTLAGQKIVYKLTIPKAGDVVAKQLRTTFSDEITGCIDALVDDFDPGEREAAYSVALRWVVR